MLTQRIAIIGGSLWGNRGASAMLETTIHNMKAAAPNLEIAVFSPYPEKDRTLSIDPSLDFYDSSPKAVIIYFLNAIWAYFVGVFGIKIKLGGGVEVLANSDLLLDIGGITFADGRLKYLPYNILTIWPSIIHHVPVIKLAQAAGPFENPIIRNSAAFFLNRCDHFFARGEKTADHLKDILVDETKVSQASDIAFNYQSEYCLSRENEKAVEQVIALLEGKAAEGKKLIGISPSVLVANKMKTRPDNYSDLVIEIIKKSHNNLRSFIVFPNASREGSKKNKNNDLRVIRNLRDRAELELPIRLYKSILWVEFDINSKGVNEIVRRIDFLLASRFHAMVASLRLSKPTIIIGWGHKYLEVMKRFGQEKFVFDDHLDTDLLLASLQSLIENETDIVNQIQRAFQVETVASKQQFDYIAGKFLEN